MALLSGVNCVQLGILALFQVLIADNFGILALFQVLIADSFGILALLQVLIAENYGILALFPALRLQIILGDVRQKKCDRRHET